MSRATVRRRVFRVCGDIKCWNVGVYKPLGAELARITVDRADRTPVLTMAKVVTALRSAGWDVDSDGRIHSAREDARKVHNG